MRILSAFLLVAFAASSLNTMATAQDYDYNLPIKEHIFDNGLKLLVIEQPNNKRVSAKIYTDMGAINEISGEYGSAHFLEHLMFKGTETLGTSNWEKEKPLFEKLYKLEAQLIAERNRARNDIRQRGVFHDYKHKNSTPEIDRLIAEIAKVDEEINQYGIEGVTMKWYQGYGGTHLTAQTETEYMHFDIDLPANNVEVFLRIEADRMTNTKFRRFDQERMILVEQRYGNLGQNTPYFKEAMDSLVGTTSRVFVPEGYLSDFEKYTRHYQRYLYETFFVVNNSTLIFVGGVTMDQMIPLVEKHFGKKKRMPEPPRYYGEEPKPSFEKRLVYRTDIISPRVEFRFQIPGVGHPDRPAFEVLGLAVKNDLQDILDAKGLQSKVSMNTRVIHTQRFGLPGSINFEVQAAENDLGAIEKVVLEAFSNMANNPFSSDKIKFAQKTLRTQWARLTADPFDLANEIGHFEVMDSWKTLKPFLQARDKTTAADVQRLIKQYFINDNRSIGLVKAKGAE